MNLVKKYEFYEKPEVGILVFHRARFPFNIFTRNVKVFFKPAFSAAGFYKVNLKLVDMEKFMELDNAFAVMSYLRSVDDNLTLTKLMVELKSP